MHILWCEFVCWVKHKRMSLWMAKLTLTAPLHSHALVLQDRLLSSCMRSLIIEKMLARCVSH